MIPPFETTPGEDGRYQLPPGIHVATWRQLVDRFETNGRRTEILAGLLRALQALRAAGCKRAFINGSFVTSKEVPADFDGCWDHEGVDFDALDPVLRNFEGRRSLPRCRPYHDYQ